MSVKKQYLKSKPLCKVTFSVPEMDSGKTESMQLVGEFNKWDTSCPPMKKLKSGLFSETLELEPGKEYQYRILINGSQWMNDPDAEKYVPNSFEGQNSVVMI